MASLGCLWTKGRSGSEGGPSLCPHLLSPSPPSCRVCVCCAPLTPRPDLTGLLQAVLQYYFASLGGSLPAQVALGYRHANGLGVPKSCRAAVLYLTGA
jgi:TPR repeat protein